MQIGVTFRILGALLLFFSATMLPPIAVSLLYQDGAYEVFVKSMVTIFLSGAALWFVFRNYQKELKTRDGFLITVLCYLALGCFSALPFYDAVLLDLTLADAFFESFSGLTTTGGTVIVGLDQLPASLLYYRQQLQWLGGMGIIVLAVAILPMLGIGGMQLYRAETPGPIKDSKLTPRIKQTAIALWSIYISLTVMCALAYWIAGMTLFDAICHSFSTVAIGGFSTHDASIGYFDSAAIEAVAVVFMLISGLNYALHFFTVRDHSIRHYFQDEEARFYLVIIIIAIVITAIVLATTLTSGETAIRQAVFQVVSIFTTTGFATTQFSEWPSILPYLLILGAFAGACAGSTGGGLKIIRVLLIYKQGLREIYRLIHPNAIFPIKVSGRKMTDNVIDAVWGFFSIYILLFIVLLLGLIATDLDFVTAFSAVGSALNNLGPGLGAVAENYAEISSTAKFLLCLGMVLGRLEIFTILVLFTAMFWRK